LRRLAALAALLVVPGLAQALEKCVAADGSVSYADVCPAGTRHAPSKVEPQLIPKPGGTVPRKPAAAPAPEVPAKTARPAPAPAPKAVAASADVQLQFYDIEGASFGAARSASAGRPTGPVQSSWKLGYEYKVRQAAGRCALDSLATKLDLVLTLPRWNPPGGTSADEVELWNHYVQALVLGEEPRFEHARVFERALPTELLALPAAPTCGELEAAMRARYEALRAQAQARFADHR
jgi:predicted secreted Zn-dependent protease